MTDICYGCVGVGMGGCRGAYNKDHPQHIECAKRKAEIAREAEAKKMIENKNEM